MGILEVKQKLKEDLQKSRGENTLLNKLENMKQGNRKQYNKVVSRIKEGIGEYGK